VNDINEKNELSDIVLNKNSSSNSKKKILLAVATLGAILIIVVMLMNTLSSKGTSNLPQAALPQEPQNTLQEQTEKEPLFEEVAMVEDDTPISSDNDLDKIAQKLKQESINEDRKKKSVERTIQKHIVKHIVKPVEKKQQLQTQVKSKIAKKATLKHKYYIQVGSFSKYKPNKHFLQKITNLGFHYTYHKIHKLNKVLVGPFDTKREANKAKKVLRAKVISGAFVIKL